MMQLRTMLSAAVLASSMLAATTGYAATTPVFTNYSAVGTRTELMGVTAASEPINGGNNMGSDRNNIQVSDDGRFVYFRSNQPNLVPGFSSLNNHAYIYDRQNGTTELVSADASGVPLALGDVNFDAFRRVMSTDGRFLLFEAGDKVYVKDRQTRELKCLSLDSAGNPILIGTNAGTMSADGQTVAFTKFSRELIGYDDRGFPKYITWEEVLLANVATGVITPIIGDLKPGRLGQDVKPSLSADGRYVSLKSNLQLTAEPLFYHGVYVYDTVARTFERIDTNATGCVTMAGGAVECDASDLPTMSNDGRFVSYRMWKRGLDSVGEMISTPQHFVADRTTKAITRTDLPAYDFVGTGGTQEFPVISANGNYVLFYQYTDRINEAGNGVMDIFAFERATGNIARLDLSTTGVAANDIIAGAAISANAATTAFFSFATNLVPGVSTPAVYVRTSLGFPLSFAVTKAEYDKTAGMLNVTATSSKGAFAGMEVLNNGAMTWNSTNSTWTYSAPVAAMPATVSVGNVEGYKVLPVVELAADTAPPVLVSSLPAAGATGVLTTSMVTINFNEAIAKGLKFSSITLKKGSSSARISTSISGNQLMIKPSASLSKNTTYTVTIPVQAVKDAAGNQSATAYSFIFKTK